MSLAAKRAYEAHSTALFGVPPTARKRDIDSAASKKPNYKQDVGVIFEDLDARTSSIWEAVAQAVLSSPADGTIEEEG